MLAELEGKVAVVTGGGSGIGAAIARACAGEGMKVVVADVDKSRADTVVSSLGRAPALAVAVDVADAASVDSLADRTYDTFGATDLLCNNAGISPIGLIWEFTSADWESLLGVNVVGVANGLRSFVPRMIAQGNGGQIVNTASDAAFLPSLRLGPYSATKHAVLGLSDALRLELAPFGIGVSALCPGGVNTNIGESLPRPSARQNPDAFNADLEALIGGLDHSVSVALEPDHVAKLVLWGVRENEPYIVTAPGHKALVAERYNAIIAAHDRVRAFDPSLP